MASQVRNSFDCREAYIEFPVVTDSRGSLTPIEFSETVPFEVRSIRWGKAGDFCSMANASFLASSKLMLFLSGNAVLRVNESAFTIDKPNIGLFIPPSLSCELIDVSKDAICLILSDAEEKMLQQYNIIELKEGKKCSISESVIFDLSSDEVRGEKSIYSTVNVPFPIERLFYIYDIPYGVKRGGHAHKSCHEMLTALKGGFEVDMDDGEKRRVVELDKLSEGLLLPAGVWATQSAYKRNTLCLVFASERYDKTGYIDNYDDFIKYT